MGHRVGGWDGLPVGPTIRRPGRAGARRPSHLRVTNPGARHRRSNKNDPNDAHSIAIAALRAPALRSVEPADHGEVLRLLSKRNSDLGRQRSRVVCRLHSLFAELSPGGIAKEMYVSNAEVLLAKVRPDTPAQQMRFDLVLELLDDVRRLDDQIKASHRRIRLAVKASGTSLYDVNGVGPVHAAEVIGYSGDVRASPTETRTPLTTAGSGRTVLGWTNRPPALTAGQSQGQPRSSDGRRHPDPQTPDQGRIYFDRKVSEGKTKKEALRSLKRQISNAVYRQSCSTPDRGPGGHSGNDS